MVEGKTVDEEGDGDDAMAVDVPPLAIGDLVEVRRGIKGEMGVLIGMNGGECTSVMFNGHNMIHRETEVAFQVPGWAYSAAVAKNPVSQAVVSQATLGLSPDSRKAMETANIALSSLAHISKFQEAASKYGYEKRAKFGAAWAHFRQTQSNQIVTVDGLARWAFYEAAKDGQQITPTNAELYSAFVFMARDTQHFRPIRPNNIRETREFYLRPAEEVQRIQWLWSQIRGNTAQQTQSDTSKSAPTEMGGFLEKCKKLVEAYRGQSTSASVAFTPVDGLFIGALIFAAVENTGSFQSPYRNIASGITKALYPLYPARSNDVQYAEVLKEIRVWRAWENVAMYKASPKGRINTLEGHGMVDWADSVWEEANLWGGKLLDVGSFEFDKDGKLSVKSGREDPNPLRTERKPNQSVIDLVKSKVLVPDTPYLPDFYPADPCAAHRRDFGDAPVFVIDSPTAHELDDGISIEETPSGTWMHVHIADPTAYLPPNNPLALIAQLRGNSVYLPERIYPMMPEEISHTRFDLRKSQCAMTFSAKIGEDGEITDYRVSPSIVRNVKIIHYDDVDDVLDWSNVYGIDKPEGDSMRWVTDTFKARGIKGPGIWNEKANKIDAESAKALVKLQKLARRHLESRLRRGGFISDQPDFELKVTPYPLSIAPPKPTKPIYAAPEEQPTIRLNPYCASHLSPAHLFVSEAMVIGGRVAAKYCIDHKVPAAYRSQSPVESNNINAESQALLHKVMASRDPASGVIPYLDFIKLLPFMPAAKVGTHPGGHASMGIPGPRDPLGGPTTSEMVGYVKVTSPLRRFGDMVMHWNIKSGILRERWAFDEGLVSGIVGRLVEMERKTKTLDGRTSKHWVAEWVRRREVLSRKNGGIAWEKEQGMWKDGWKGLSMPTISEGDTPLRDQRRAFDGFEGAPEYNVLIQGTRDGVVGVGVVSELGGAECRVARIGGLGDGAG
ncbi:hypothetical protein HDV00_007538 [Rhizophlyctis rosea]|nr:hypothetical protein HDV00_007538 [Rhizophlyctis rosea]